MGIALNQEGHPQIEDSFKLHSLVNSIGGLVYGRKPDLLKSSTSKMFHFCMTLVRYSTQFILGLWRHKYLLSVLLMTVLAFHFMDFLFEANYNGSQCANVDLTDFTDFTYWQMMTNHLQCLHQDLEETKIWRFMSNLLWLAAIFGLSLFHSLMLSVIVIFLFIGEIKASFIMVFMESIFLLICFW